MYIIDILIQFKSKSICDNFEASAYSQNMKKEILAFNQGHENDFNAKKHS